jgi:MFS superfamily sulfate permease-like transporter
MFKIPDFRQNIISGLLVSFVALPLCIAISMASGFPPLSGVFTAIIGGIIVSQISGSNVTINGPAAGMIVVILDAVQKLGYSSTLAAIVFASILQILFSLTSLPEKMRKFPESIIRGMMMAIGLIVILKQLFILLGYRAPSVGLIEMIGYLPNAFMGMEIETFALGSFAIIFIFLWKKYLEKHNVFRKIPVYLVVIIITSILAALFDISNQHHHLMESFATQTASTFLNVPNSILTSFSFPDFSKFYSFDFAISAFTIFAVGSLETVLSALAVDKVDPKKRRTNLKKDLRAVGIGNLICGSIGALPMISEIVRSSANVKYGATNKWSNFFHGIFLLLMITIFNQTLKFIPLCVLAGMLIVIGWNLINFKLFSKIYRRHKYNFLTIISVIFFTLYIDLLVGIVAGVAVYFLTEKVFHPLKGKLQSGVNK